MIVRRTAPEERIRWQCSACSDAGFISNWEDSPFDLARRGLTLAQATLELVIPDPVAAALREVQLIDPDCERLIFGLRAHPDGLCWWPPMRTWRS